MEVFADDLDRLLAGEAIWARPAGLLRKIAKGMRRHRFLTVSTAALLILSLALTIIGGQISKQKKENFRAAVGRFKPFGEFMLVNNPDSQPWFWCDEVDSLEPGGYMMKALFEIESDEWEQAISSLNMCSARCRKRSEDLLEKEASYLMGLIRLAQADELGESSPEKERLYQEAQKQCRADLYCNQW